MRTTFVISVLAAVFLFVWTSGVLLPALIPDDAEDTLDVITEAIADQRSAPIMAVLDPSINPGPAQNSLRSIWNGLPKGEPETISLVGSNYRTNWTFGQGDMETIRAVYRYRYEEMLIVVSVVLQRHESENDWRFTNLNVNSADEQEPVHLEFTDMSTQQYVFAAAGGISFMLSLITLTAIAFTPRIKRRIIWTIFVILSYPTFFLNWTSGEWGLRAPFIISPDIDGIAMSLLPVALFGVGIDPGYMIEPSILIVGFPFGALFFWYRMAKGGPTRRVQKPRKTAEAPAPVPDAAVVAPDRGPQSPAPGGA